MSQSTTGHEYDAPGDDEPAFECAYCGRPFAREDLLALHRGQTHPAELDDNEVAAFREAHAAEEEAIGSFRLRALGALVLIYFFLLMVYALV
ncbi:DUF7410 domain-containing protein [Haloarcula litorea]|uniref:DUF7410 domain-containing protein n=1 Tax=Haloarcula litorea TaxID=3032579 RepID=UPI0023E8CDE8|nr:C2H2-type zinc finger protein [Halomicroarcula sp. GDY20]